MRCKSKSCTDTATDDEYCPRHAIHHKALHLTYITPYSYDDISAALHRAVAAEIALDQAGRIVGFSGPAYLTLITKVSKHYDWKYPPNRGDSEPPLSDPQRTLMYQILTFNAQLRCFWKTLSFIFQPLERVPSKFSKRGPQ